MAQALCVEGAQAIDAHSAVKRLARAKLSTSALRYQVRQVELLLWVAVVRDGNRVGGKSWG